jgi:hypothetical protein
MRMTYFWNTPSSICSREPYYLGIVFAFFENDFWYKPQPLPSKTFLARSVIALIMEAVSTSETSV